MKRGSRITNKEMITYNMYYYIAIMKEFLEYHYR